MISIANHEDVKKDMEEFAALIKEMLPDDIEYLDEETYKMTRLSLRMLRNCQYLMDDQVKTLNNIETKLDRVLANQAKA